MSKTLKVVIADDHPIIRDGFHMILSTEEGMEVAGVAKDGAEAVSLVLEHKPDVVLLDLHMPGKSGMEALREIKNTHPFTKVLIISSYIDDDTVIECLSNGASGILLKDWPTEKIITAMKDSVKNQLVIPESYTNKLIGVWKKDKEVSTSEGDDRITAVEQMSLPLNKREKEIFLKVMEGKKNSEIASELYLSIGTVKNYISSLYKKLGVTTRSEMINFLHLVEREK